VIDDRLQVEIKVQVRGCGHDRGTGHAVAAD
jgi:hypothetical protein